MNKAQQERIKKIQQAMLPLIGDVRFQAFMKEVEEQKNAAVIDACMERVIASDRLTMAVLGEIRAYDGILSFHQGQLDLAQQVQDEAEAAE